MLHEVLLLLLRNPYFHNFRIRNVSNMTKTGNGSFCTLVNKVVPKEILYPFERIC